MKKIRLRCSCGKTLSAAIELAGRKAQCSGCGNHFVVPQPATVTADTAKKSLPAFDDSLRLAPIASELQVDRPKRQCESCSQDMGLGTTVCINCGYHRKLKRKLEVFGEPEEPDTALAYAFSYGSSFVLIAGAAFFMRSLNGPQFLVFFFVLFCLYGTLTPLLRRIWVDSDLFNFGALFGLVGVGVFRIVDSAIQGRYKFGFLAFAIVLTGFLYCISLTQVEAKDKEPPMLDSRGKMSTLGFLSTFIVLATILAVLFFVPSVSQTLGKVTLIMAMGLAVVFSILWSALFGHMNGSGGWGNGFGNCSSCSSSSCSSSSCGGGGCGGGCGGCNG